MSVRSMTREPLPIGSNPWWRETVVYQIYPRSFADENGDGVGDLDGVRSKLGYLADLGVETLWLSPFFASPQRDFGYDISDYRDVAPEYGSLETVDCLIAEAHARGLKIVLDMVLNHTSDRHPWFEESRSSRTSPKRDWYVWRDGRRPSGKAPPNNWRSMLGRRGWHHDARTDQWYWAQFLPFQPDLNYRNPEVREAMLDTIRFWLARGVDGFRLDIVNALYEDEQFRDNPWAWTFLPSDGDPTMFFQGAERTLDHPDTLAFMKVLRATIDEFDDPPRFLVGEVNADLPTVRAYSGEQGDGLNLTFQFESLGVALEASALRELITRYERTFPDPLLPTWVFSNHDRMRRISRLEDDPQRAKLNAALQLTARGVPFVYYGEEIGMVQQRFPVRTTLDALAKPLRWVPQAIFDFVRERSHESINRDECRTPMQWSDGPNAGFSPAGVPTWLPVGPDQINRTVASQQSDPTSLFSCYRRFLHARRGSPALRAGALELLPASETGPCVLGYLRRHSSAGADAAVLLNASESEAEAVHHLESPKVLVSTDVARTTCDARTIRLGPWEGVVLQDGAVDLSGDVRPVSQ